MIGENVPDTEGWRTGKNALFCGLDEPERLTETRNLCRLFFMQ